MVTYRTARRSPGRCQDCGWHKPVRTITFWSSGVPYTVCAECERGYRTIINWPVREQDDFTREQHARYRARMGKVA